MPDNSFGKDERLCGKTTIAALFKDGSWGVEGCLKFCYARRPAEEGKPCRILISVPKRLFKRAVRRNLLKRRIREAYRTRKSILSAQGRFDLLFQYNSAEIADSSEIAACVEKILKRIK